MRKVNKEIAQEIMNMLSEQKIKVLDNACTRNLMLTSSYGLEDMTMTIYLEGWKIQLDGCRSSFSVFAKDNDGELEITRKPAESKLHKLYEEWDKTDNVIDLYKITEPLYEQTR